MVQNRWEIARGSIIECCRATLYCRFNVYLRSQPPPPQPQSPWSLLPIIPASALTLSCQGKHPGAGLARTSLAAFPPLLLVV